MLGCPSEPMVPVDFPGPDYACCTGELMLSDDFCKGFVDLATADPNADESHLPWGLQMRGESCFLG